MAALRLIVAVVLLILSALVALGNIVGVATAYRNRWRGIDKGYSCVPFVSLILGLLGWWAGHGRLGSWPLLPAIIDPGTWTWLGLPWIALKYRRDKRDRPR